MQFDHLAVFTDSESEADKFYKDLLGLEKKYTFRAPAVLMKKIFNLDKDFQVIRYGRNNFDIEVFIDPDKKASDGTIRHVGIKVDDRDRLFTNAEAMGYSVIKAQKTLAISVKTRRGE